MANGGSYDSLQFGIPDFQAEQFSDPYALPTAASVPGMGAAAGSLVLRLADKFPALAGAIATFRVRGIPMSAEKLLGLMRRFGPAALLSLGILSIEVLQDLFAYNATRKRRRMNPLNPKALRRGLRRLESFDRYACRVKAQIGGYRRPRKKCA